MTSHKMTPPEWAAKVDYEGGLYDTVTGYGLDETDLNEADDPSFYALVKEYVEKARRLDEESRDLEDLLEEYHEQYNQE